LIPLIGSAMIRQQNAVLLIVILAPVTFYVVYKQSNSIYKMLMILIFVGITSLIYFFLMSKGYSKYFNVEYFTKEMNYRSSGEAAYLTWMSYEGILDILLYSPIRILYFIFTPFPW